MARTVGDPPSSPTGALRAVAGLADDDASSRWWSGLRGHPLLSNRVAPFFLALDVLAWALGSSLTRERAQHGVVLLVVLLALLAQGGAYRSRLTLSAMQDWPKLAGRTLAATAVVVSALLLLPDATGARELLLTGAYVAVTLVLVRACGYALVRAARARGLVSHRTLILGAGRIGAHLVETLQAHPEYGLRPVGFLDSHPLLTPDALPVPVLGANDALASTIASYAIEDVIVAFGSLREEQLVEVLRTCDRLECEIFFVPRLFELHAVSRDMDHVWGLPLVRQHRAAFRSMSWQGKRLLDILLAGVALGLLAPLFAVLAVLVRWEGGPGVLFRQTRMGLDGRPFELLKFRTLQPADTQESAQRWTVADDERLRPVGRMLRRTSLDEIPQLWNILRGEMSLVGPRPERPHFVDAFTSTLPRYPARHRVPAGLTGWAQVHGLRGDTSIADRARFDNYYIENWSLGLDLRILLLTVVSVLRRTGA